MMGRDINVVCVTKTTTRVIYKNAHLKLKLGEGSGLMKTMSGHIKFPEGIKYQDLLPIYKDLFMKFLSETKQTFEEPNYVNVLLRTNLMDLEKNGKPEGFNRQGSMRLMFPISDKVEFYIYSQKGGQEVVRITEAMSKFLKKHGFEHAVSWNRLILHKRK